MTEDDLKMQFELVRQSIGTWSADAAHFVAQGSKSRQEGTHEDGQIDAAARTLRAIQLERETLSAAALLVPNKSDDLARGIEIALNELELLERDIGAALEEMR